MKIRSLASFAIFVVLATAFGALGMAINQTKNSDREDRSAAPPRVFTTADCSFFKEGPEKFTTAVSEHREEIARTTAWVSSKTAAGEAGANVVRKNFIDAYLFDAMGSAGVQPALLCTDSEYIRRVTLDLTGRIPSSADVRTFVASKDPQKRDALVNSLLGTPEFVDRWTMYFGDLLKNTAFATNINRYIDGRTAFYNFIKDSIAQNKPYNQFATELLTASGDSFLVGAANFTVGGTVPMGPIQDTYDGMVVQSANSFLGINVFDCLLCHSGAGHLTQVNSWGTHHTRTQAWGMSAFFARTNIQRVTVSPQPQIIKSIVTDRTTGNYQLGTTSGNRVPRTDPGGATSVSPAYIFNGQAPAASTNYRVEYAKALTGDIQFARAAVNYLWAHFFGMGLVDPPNGFDLERLDPNNPPPAPWTLQPTNPGLLNTLAQQFISSGYNLQYIMKLITQSSAYQLSSRYDAGTWSDAYIPYFARHFVRRLDAEEIHDAVAKATGILGNYVIQATYNGTAYNTTPVQWAMQLPDTTEPNSDRTAQSFLNLFLRGDRDQKPRTDAASIQQALGLMNNTFVLTRIRSNNSQTRVAQLLAANLSNDALIDELFLTTLSRFPTPQEKTTLLGVLSGSTNKASTVEDIQWSLLNKVDFSYNY